MASTSALLDMKCLVCKKAFNFSEDFLNKVVECPHCKEPVRCRVEAQTLEPRSEPSAPWTRKQKLVTVIALQAFFIQATDAPWQVRYSYRYGATTSQILHGPVTGIRFDDDYQVEHAALQLGPLLATWTVTAVVYLGLLKLFRAVKVSNWLRYIGFALEVVMVIACILLFLVIAANLFS